MSKVTLEDISKALNVSKNTVSKALRGADGVSDDLREKIHKKAVELGYKKIFFPLKQISNVTLLVRQNSLSDVTFWPKVLSGIEAAAREKNLKLSLLALDKTIEESNELPSNLLNGTDGLIIVGTLNDKFIKLIKASKMPFVVIDHYSLEIECDYINSSNVSGVYKIINHLYSKGHKNVGFICSSLDGFSYEERYEACIKYAKKFSITMKEDFIWLDCPYSDIPFLKAKIEGIKSRDDAPTAWICVNDSLAITTARAFTELGFNIPDDISIIGFDNISELFYPGITTIDVPKEYRGKKAVELLLARVENPKKPYENILLDNKLLLRNSVKNLNEEKQGR